MVAARSRRALAPAKKKEREKRKKKSAGPRKTRSQSPPFLLIVTHEKNTHRAAKIDSNPEPEPTSSTLMWRAGDSADDAALAAAP